MGYQGEMYITFGCLITFLLSEKDIFVALVSSFDTIGHHHSLELLELVFITRRCDSSLLCIGHVLEHLAALVRIIAHHHMVELVVYLLLVGNSEASTSSASLLD